LGYPHQVCGELNKRLAEPRKSEPNNPKLEKKKPDLVVDDHFPLFSWHIFWGIPWYTSCISPIGSSEVLLSTDMRNDSTKAVPSDLSAAKNPDFSWRFQMGVSINGTQ